MNKNLLIWVILFLIAVLVFSGCFESQGLTNEEKRFVGTWDMEGTEVTINFYSNGEMDTVLGDKYEVKDGKLAILSKFAGGYTQVLYDYSFSNNDTKLVLINLDTEVIHSLIKQ
jgi:hypothetical protein